MPADMFEHDWFQIAIDFWLSEIEYLREYFTAHREELNLLIDKNQEAATATVATELFTQDGLFHQRLWHYLTTHNIKIIGDENEKKLFPALRRVLTLIIMRWFFVGHSETFNAESTLRTILSYRS